MLSVADSKLCQISGGLAPLPEKALPPTQQAAPLPVSPPSPGVGQRAMQGVAHLTPASPAGSSGSRSDEVTSGDESASDADGSDSADLVALREQALREHHPQPYPQAVASPLQPPGAARESSPLAAPATLDGARNLAGNAPRLGAGRGKGAGEGAAGLGAVPTADMSLAIVPSPVSFCYHSGKSFSK